MADIQPRPIPDYRRGPSHWPRPGPPFCGPPAARYHQLSHLVSGAIDALREAEPFVCTRISARMKAFWRSAAEVKARARQRSTRHHS